MVAPKPLPAFVDVVVNLLRVRPHPLGTGKLRVTLCCELSKTVNCTFELHAYLVVVVRVALRKVDEAERLKPSA